MNKIFIISILMTTVRAEYPTVKSIDIQGSIWSWVPVKILPAPENYPTDYYPEISIENGISPGFDILTIMFVFLIMIIKRIVSKQKIN